ncbi:DoxX family protein [Pseudonocardia sp. H11422]|uniref:DoxX family protein n=1 Tax=Pseudonocardia sp. H11422 TaxID=2835866 RepID=UPI001BDD817B|nr:DoxX family protein [Pseudonocardia sp. H11422]
MNVFVWLLQIALAVAFLGAGAMKLARPRKALADSGMGYVEDFSDGAVKAIGALEVLAAIGIVLPWATGIAPALTPLAALGLVVIMIGAAVVHARRKEYPMIGINVVLGVLAAIVAFSRF